MVLAEIVAEKLRALAQRDRPTDLADLAMVLDRDEVDEGRVRDLAEIKFRLVKAGNHRARIEETIERLRLSYDAAVAAVAPDAPPYASAARTVAGRLTSLLP